MTNPKPSPLDIAHFRFGLIAPVIQDKYPDSSAMAYYRRVTQQPIELPDGTFTNTIQGHFKNGLFTTKLMVWMAYSSSLAPIKAPPASLMTWP